MTGKCCNHTPQTNFFIACGDFLRLLITFANSLDPDQTDRMLVMVLILIQTVRHSDSVPERIFLSKTQIDLGLQTLLGRISYHHHGILKINKA